MTQWGVDTLFNPAKRHMDEEKRRLQATRAEVGDNSGGRRIDLESGKVRISRGPKDETDQSDTGQPDGSAGGADTDEVAAPEDARADAASVDAVDAVDAATDAEADTENGS